MPRHSFLPPPPPRVTLFTLRLIALVGCFAGTMLILEFLGDIDAFQDRFLPSAMGEVSFHQAGVPQTAPGILYRRKRRCLLCTIGP